MAYNYNNEESTILGQVEKNDRGEVIQVSKIRNKISGSEFIDIRLMYTPEGSDNLAPTRKGIRFSTEKLADITSILFGQLSKDEADAIINGSDEDDGEADGMDEE